MSDRSSALSGPLVMEDDVRVAEKTRRVLICAKHGGFSLSAAAKDRLLELGSEHAKAEVAERDTWERTPWSSLLDDSWLKDIPRDDPLALQVFDEMGQGAAAPVCELRAVEIPADVEWQIEEYDGLEWVAEKHRTWP